MTQNAGDSNEITREFLDSICIEERLLNSNLADTGFDFFGHHYSTPIMSAAFSHLEDNGGVKLARGFHQAGALNWWGMSGDEEITAIYKEGPDTVRIIKPYADSSKVYHRIEQALSFGAVGVGMDIDHAYSGNGTYDNVLGEEMRPVSTDQLSEYIKAAKGTPFIIKGVLSVHDAVMAKEAGASAVVVSHHHGMIQYMVPPLAVLPDIRRAVGRRFKIYVDCGMDTAYDAFKALALGADGVCVSRSILEDLRSGGEEAVAARVGKMTGTLRTIMSRAGAGTLKDLSPEMLWFKEEYRKI